MLIATKSQDTAGALASLRAAAPASTPVVCLQNGVENERIALRLLANVYGAVVMTPTAHLEPGIVQAYGTRRTGVIDVGPLPVRPRRAGEEVSRALAESGFSSVSRPDIMRFKYAKLLSNLGNAVDAICEPGPAAEELTELAQEEGRARPGRGRNRLRGRRGQRRQGALGAPRRCSRSPAASAPAPRPGRASPAARRRSRPTT